MDHLRDLALFVAVAEAKSFTKAAAQLGVPTSTLSRRIADLEASMQLKLLVRSTRQVELTEAGALYLSLGEGIVAAAREAHQQVRGLAERPQGTLRMSVEAEIGPRLVAPVLADYLQRYPDVRIDLDLSPRRVDLLAEGFNLALRIGRLPDSGLTVRRLAMLTASLYAAPSYLARRGTPNHPADLLEHDRIHLLHKGDRGEWRLMQGDTTIEVPSDSVMCANNMTMIRHLARLGVGIAVIDDLMASEDVARGLLRTVLPGWTLEPMPISILTPTRLLAAKTRAFVDLLAQRVTGMVGLTP
jgi:DNA-binding transcriptional LysR family regulator